MITIIKLFNPYIDKTRRVKASREDVLGKYGQQMNNGYTGPFVDIDTGEEFTINLAGWAEVSVIEAEEEDTK